MKTTGLNFIEAVKTAMKHEKQIRRMAWLNEDFSIYVEGDFLFEKISDKKYVINFNDIISGDWEIVMEPTKIMTFMEAVAAMRKSNWVARLSWGNCIPITIINGIFRLKGDAFVRGDYRLVVEDVEATDWIVVEEK